MQDVRYHQRRPRGGREHQRDHFEVYSPDVYDRRAPVLQKPLFLGDYSLDGNGKFCHDRRNLNFVAIDWKSSKKVKYDLNVAYDKVKKINRDRNKKINLLLQWLSLNRQKVQGINSDGNTSQRVSADFVSRRGLLRDLHCTPFDSDGWIICATKFKGTIYLCPFGEETSEYQTDRHKRMSSWGYKFEQFMTDGANVSEGNDENLAYYVVLKSQIGSHSLIFSSEVDGADSDKYSESSADVDAFVELKTNKLLYNDRDKNNFYRHKLMRWWSQSSISGIPTVVCGFRDANGIVREVKKLKVKDMPSEAQRYWRPNVMTNFLEEFLTFVKKQVLIDDPEEVYKFERKHGGGDVSFEYIGKRSEWSFMPEWFVDNMLKM